MKLSSVNYPLALVAAILVFVVNPLWYSPWLFGPVWAAGTGFDLSGTPSIFSLVASFALCLVSAIVVFAFAAALVPKLPPGGAIKAGLILNLGLGGGIMLLNMLSGMIYLPHSVPAMLVAAGHVYVVTQIYCSLACYSVKKDNAGSLDFSSYFSQIRYLHCLLAAAIVFFIGMLIYGVLFGEVWMEGVGYNLEDLAAAPPPILGILYNAVSSFLIAALIYVLAAALDFRGWRCALALSLWIGLGLVGASMLQGGLFSPYPWEVTAIDMSYIYLKTLVFCIFACVWPKSAI